MRGAATRYFAYEKQHNIPVHDTETLDLMKLLNSNNYEKGAWILHMLRERIGDEAFFKGLRDYYNAHRDANATAEDLRRALEQSSGKNLRGFFLRWVYGAGHPIYRVHWGVNRRGSLLRVNVSQVQKGPAFLDPIPIELVVNGQTIKRTIYPQSKLAALTIRLSAKPTSTKFDPNETLLKEVVEAP